MHIKKIFIVFVLLFSLCSCKMEEIDIHIFSDINECQSIIQNNTNSAEIEIYSSEKDKNLKNLEYDDYFGCKYTCDGYSFEIFAYNFIDSDTAYQYFENITGKRNNPNPTFSDNSNLSDYRRVVINKNMAYTVYCKNQYKEKVLEFINEIFSLDIKKQIINT